MVRAMTDWPHWDEYLLISHNGKPLRKANSEHQKPTAKAIHLKAQGES